jgi:hypothetical protein
MPPRQMRLFSNESHDPGGNVATPMPAGMKGAAEFYGPRDCYRPWLSRWIGEDPLADYALFCGANPSTATAFVNDPTIRREWDFTREWGYWRYQKVNICDFRATYPSDLRAPGVVPRGDKNLQTIRDLAADAEIVVMCFGEMHKSLHPFCRETIDVLRRDGRALMCLHVTKAGWPGHPLYLASTARPQSYAA